MALKDLLAVNGKLDDLYAQTVSRYVRERYSVDAELAILRQRDDKPEDFEAYNRFAEECKERAKQELLG